MALAFFNVFHGVLDAASAFKRTFSMSRSRRFLGDDDDSATHIFLPRALSRSLDAMMMTLGRLHFRFTLHAAHCKLFFSLPGPSTLKGFRLRVHEQRHLCFCFVWNEMPSLDVTLHGFGFFQRVSLCHGDDCD